MIKIVDLTEELNKRQAELDEMEENGEDISRELDAEEYVMAQLPLLWINSIDVDWDPNQLILKCAMTKEFDWVWHDDIYLQDKDKITIVDYMPKYKPEGNELRLLYRDVTLHFSVDDKTGEADWVFVGEDGFRAYDLAADCFLVEDI